MSGYNNFHIKREQQTFAHNRKAGTARGKRQMGTRSNRRKLNRGYREQVRMRTEYVFVDP